MIQGEKVYCLGLKSRLKEKFPDVTTRELCQIFSWKYDVVKEFLSGEGEYIPSLATEIEKSLKEPDTTITQESEFVKKYFLKNFHPITTNYQFLFGSTRTTVESILNGHYNKGSKLFYKTAYLILKEELSRQEAAPQTNNDKVLEIMRNLKLNSPDVLATLKNIYTAIQSLED